MKYKIILSILLIQFSITICMNKPLMPWEYYFERALERFNEEYALNGNHQSDIEEKRINTIVECIKNNVNINSVFTYSSLSPLQLTIREHCLGFNHYIEIKKSYNYEVIKILIDSKAEVNFENDNECSVLDMAIRS